MANIFEILTTSRIHIRALAKKIGFAYSAVYKEVIHMIQNGFLGVEIYGRVKVLYMERGMVKSLNKIPIKQLQITKD